MVSRIINGHQKLTLEQAQAFAKVLEVDVSEVITRAKLATAQVAQNFSAGFAESDVVKWQPGEKLAEAAQVKSVAALFGGDRPGVDVWRVKSRAMALDGLKEGDFMLVDTHQAERVKPGDVVVAQIYNRGGDGATVLRRFEAPVLVSASLDPAEARAHVVDGVNVVIMGKVIASWRAT